MSNVVIFGTESRLGLDLVALYAGQGHTVTGVKLLPLPSAADLAPLLAASIDLAVFADGVEPSPTAAGAVTRSSLRAGLERLTFAPFAIATQLRPALARSRGRLALLSRNTAGMTVPDPEGRYADRSFRAAAHALWRCLAIEWQEAGIACVLVALPNGAIPAATLPAVIAAAPTGTLVDSSGDPLGW